MVNDLASRLNESIKTSKKIIKLLNTYEKIREKPVENAYSLEKKLDDIEKAAADLVSSDEKSALLSWLSAERAAIEKFKEEFRFTFGKELAALLSPEGLTVKGQYPVLRIGLYTLKVNFQFGHAELYFGPEIEKLKAPLPLQPAAIFKSLKKFDKEISTVKSDPEKLYEELRSAYVRKCKTGNKSYGDKMFITEILADFVINQQSRTFWADPQKSHFTEYPRPRLSYLLYYLKKNNMCEKGMHLHVATFDATVNKHQSIWVPENEMGEGTHYEYISFHDEPARHAE